jgi:hypothetical protein
MDIARVTRQQKEQRRQEAVRQEKVRLDRLRQEVRAAARREEEEQEVAPSRSAPQMECASSQVGPVRQHDAGDAAISISQPGSVFCVRREEHCSLMIVDLPCLLPQCRHQLSQSDQSCSPPCTSGLSLTRAAPCCVCQVGCQFVSMSLARYPKLRFQMSAVWLP